MAGPRLSIIPARAATDRALKPRDLQVLCVLGRHTDDFGWCRRSQVKMAEEMGCARATVFEAIERLIKAGYLERFKQESDSNRDSAHVYRVILDPQHPNVAAIVDRDPPCRQVGTPAGMSAPPADVEPAPPAGPGPAPINDPYLTPPLNIEREIARATEREGAHPLDDRKRAEAAFWAGFKNWPRFDVSPKDPMIAMWAKLSGAEREEAIAGVATFLDANKRAGRDYPCAIATYLKERMWQKVVEPAVSKSAPHVVPPFGVEMAAGVWGCELINPASGDIPDLMGWEKRSVHAGMLSEEVLRRQKQAVHGWPRVNDAFSQAGNARPITVFRAQETALPHGWFEAVRVGSPRWQEWRDEHAGRGWPWLPDPGRQEWVFFPAGGPGRLSEFEALVKGSSDVGVGREAAE